MRTNGKTKSEIGYIIINDRNLISDVSVLNELSTGNDYRMVHTKIYINKKKVRILCIINKKAIVLDKTQV